MNKCVLFAQTNSLYTRDCREILTQSLCFTAIYWLQRSVNLGMIMVFRNDQRQNGPVGAEKWEHSWLWGGGLHQLLCLQWCYNCCLCDQRLVMRRWYAGLWRGAREPDRSPTAGLGAGQCTQTLPVHQQVCSNITRLHTHSTLSLSHYSMPGHNAVCPRAVWHFISSLPFSQMTCYLIVFRFIKHYWYLLYIDPIFACLCVSVLFCHVYIWTAHIRCSLLLLLTHTQLSLSLSRSLPSSDSLLSLLTWLFDLPLPPLCSLFLCHCPFHSWSRFCRVGFPLSTRPCWTGAHAECFQSLPKIWNDIPMWIL